MLVSGGVDSTVCAALLHKALNPDQVIAFHIDNGFMRKNESALVEKSLNKIGLDMKSEIKQLVMHFLIIAFMISNKRVPAVLQCNYNNSDLQRGASEEIRH